MPISRKPQPKQMEYTTEICATEHETLELGRRLGSAIRGGNIILLYGGLGAGKTLMTKGMLDGLGFDPDEVTSPSFTLVNLYKTRRLDIYHIDLWRLEPGHDIAGTIGLDEIRDDPKAALIIEWPERLGDWPLDHAVMSVTITGDGDDPRTVEIGRPAVT